LASRMKMVGLFITFEQASNKSPIRIPHTTRDCIFF
jgi:hypothetical protein